MKILHLRYTELYSYFITFVWFVMCENVNCALIVSPLNATLYYVLPNRKFPEACGAQVFKQVLKHRHQEVITKVTCKFIYGQAVVCRKCCGEKRIVGI